MTPDIIAVFVSQGAIIVALSIVAYKTSMQAKRLEALENYLQLFSEATMGHIFELRDAALNESNREKINQFIDVTK
jgi:hypothetical protein